MHMSCFPSHYMTTEIRVCINIHRLFILCSKSHSRYISDKTKLAVSRNTRACTSHKLEILSRYFEKKIIHPAVCEIRELILNIYLLLFMSLLLLNSSLNPLLGCWKMKEVRQAAKDTIRQFGYSRS